MSNKNEMQQLADRIRKMKSCIKLDTSRVYPGETFKYWRNFFATSGRDEDFEALVAEGLASKTVSSINKDETVYHLTDEGVKYLAKFTDIKIEKEEQ